MRVAIAGASGYTGLELIRIVLRHPDLELAAVTSEQRAGVPVGEAFPGLRGLVDLTFESLDPVALAERVEIMDHLREIQHFVSLAPHREV